MKNLLTTQQQKNDFDKMANDYKNWFRKTRAHHLSAKKLFKSYKNSLKEMQKNGTGKVPTSFWLSDPMLLLEGFAIETLLKGLYLVDGGKLSQDGKLLPLSKSHDLATWCKRTNTAIDSKEENLFKFLTLIIKSYGRYPVPLHYEINPYIKKAKVGYTQRYTWSHNDMVLIDDFIISIIGNDS